MSADQTGSSNHPAPFSIAGLRLGTAQAGIKRTDRDDVLVVELPVGASCAAVFTRNAFCAAPVLVARNHLRLQPRWLLINSGNANAGTGSLGLEHAHQSCEALAALTGGTAQQVLPFSTGVIGEYLPVEKIRQALPAAVDSLHEDGWERASRAIMTTDTRPKLASRSVEIGGHPIRITGIAKGAGMIQPNMATMLSFIGTDAAVEPACLQQILNSAADQTFNCISVDGDTSTNDACVLMATGRSGASLIDTASPHLQAFADAVTGLCAELAEAIIRDGEGATKLIRIQVQQAASPAEAREVGKTIAHSPLVKTAFFAGDPNWGRILAAVGRSGLQDLDIERVSLWLDDVCIVERGGRSPSYTEQAGQTVMAKPDILIRVALGRGEAEQTVLSCDLSHEYVRINAEYRT
jgi:glutamate N-acetyltransferase / amino-acid N-acetyltransferase